MENKKRDLIEEIPLVNVCIGLKIDNFELTPGVSFGMKTFAMLERMNYEIGIVGQEQFIIYKDIEEELYSYVGSDGRVFIPSDRLQYPASNHLASVTDIKNIREIVQGVLKKSREIPNQDENFQRIIASYQQLEDTFVRGESEGKRTMIKLGNIISCLNEFITMYCFAFGNPFEQNIQEMVRPMTPEEVAEMEASEKTAQEARSQFKIIDNELSERGRS